MARACGESRMDRMKGFPCFTGYHGNEHESLDYYIFESCYIHCQLKSSLQKRSRIKAQLFLNPKISSSLLCRKQTQVGYL